MKKFLSLICAMSLTLAMFTGCGQSNEAPAEPESAPSEVSEEAPASSEASSEAPSEEAAPSSAPSESAEEAEKEVLDIVASTMNGPTAIGLSYFMDGAENGRYEDNNYSFSIAKSSDEVVPKIIKGEIDFASVPANLASVIYNKPESNVQVLGINTLGVLYILESGDTVHSVEDLRGKTILATGKNHTPEQVITHILNENGMKIGEDVMVEWKSEPAECLAALMNQENAIAMLPQPFASAAQLKSEKIRPALNMTEEWDKIEEGKENPSTLVTGVVIAQKDFIDEHPEAVSAFMDHYKESVEFVNNNIEEASALVEKYGVVKAPVAKKAIPACNITFIEGEEMKTKLSGYLDVLFQQNPKSVGGKLPDDNFYYAR